MKVLVIEDEVDLLISISNYLGKLGKPVKLTTIKRTTFLCCLYDFKLSWTK